jgi:hypothetical protein
VVVSRDVARANFGAFVRRTLRAAHDRGLTDDAIARVTGVGDSTFHRWAKGDWQRAPGITKVIDFCVGLGAAPEDALAALGVRGGAVRAEPDPMEDPDVRRIARLLADPNVSPEEKAAVRHTLRLLAHVKPSEVGS